MRNRHLRFSTHTLVILVALGFAASGAPSAQTAPKRPMTFLDVQQMRSAGSPAPSPDGRWMLYTLSTMDWNAARRQTDIHLVSMQDGVGSTRQLTFTKEKNETSPRWSKDGSFFVFLSNRDAPENASSRNQLYLMRPDGGEARRITDARDGVSNFAFSRDGEWIAFRSGRSGEEQLYRLSVKDIDKGAEQLTKHPTGVGTWQWAPDSRRIYFVSPDSADPDEKARREKRFTVNIRNAETPLASLWALELSGGQGSHSTKRLTEDSSYSVGNFNISDDGKWIGFQ
ncbi:MAG TPA: hypothetical protein VGD94_09140, partial [Vicinamibacterales bacterium]